MVSAACHVTTCPDGGFISRVTGKLRFESCTALWDQLGWNVGGGWVVVGDERRDGSKHVHTAM